MPTHIFPYSALSSLHLSQLPGEMLTAIQWLLLLSGELKGSIKLQSFVFHMKGKRNK